MLTTKDNYVRCLLQGEMQQLRDKLAITERTAKSEAQLKVPSEDQISCSFVVISIDREFFKFPSSISFLCLITSSLNFSGKVSIAA